MQTGVYSLTVTDANGCVYRPGPLVVQLQDPFPAGIVGDKSACDEVRLSVVSPGSSTYTYQWRVEPVPPGSQGATTGNSRTISHPDTYSVTVTALSGSTECASMEDTVIVFGDPDTPVIVRENLSCNPYSEILRGYFI